MRSPSTLPAAGLLVALALAACSGSNGLDVEGARTQIGRSLRNAYDLPVSTVRCPDDVELQKGSRFRCTVRIGGRPLGVTVTQRSADGDLRVVPDAAVLRTPRVEADAARRMASQFDRPSVTVECGPPAVRVLAPRSTFTCTASDGTDRQVLTIRVRDVNGSLTYTLD